MSTFIKKYPRALVKPTTNATGYTIDLIQRQGAKPKRVKATYASIPWAHRAALMKLGVPANGPKQASK